MAEAMDTSDETLDQQALYYHRNPRPGKIAVYATKPMATQRDLALAYSPGVAAACRAIVEDPKASTMSRRAETWWPSLPMVLLSWGWATSVRWRQAGDGRKSCPFQEIRRD